MSLFNQVFPFYGNIQASLNEKMNIARHYDVSFKVVQIKSDGARATTFVLRGREKQAQFPKITEIILLIHLCRDEL